MLQVITQVTNTSSPALVAQALSALSIKETCAMLPVINNYTGHFNQNNRYTPVLQKSRNAEI